VGHEAGERGQGPRLRRRRARGRREERRLRRRAPRMSAAESQGGAPSLVDLLLAEQRTLRAVDEFSAWHADADHPGARFETLIPSQAPGAGQQYAFAVDLDACTGCKACVTACHSLNGLEPAETWRKVGEIETTARAPRGGPTRQTVTTACHHCESPACLAGCPVQAYEKDAATGIVIHLDDQCIGCRYCQLMCPYDVPQFSERLGIVRKCDMCHGRLAAGEAPACVQGCPNQAISIEVVDVAAPRVDVAATSAGDAMLLPMAPGGMPRSALTRPTTRYRSERSPAVAMRAVEGREPQPAEAHVPLALMLVLTQGAIGTLFVDCALASLATFAPASPGREARFVVFVLAALMTFAGLGASVLHLGRPQWAFRAFLGLRTSWMSREIVVFGGFATALVAALATSTAGLWGAWGAPGAFGLSGEVVDRVARLDGLARAGALTSGLLGLYCSAQIYAVTGRPLWRLDRTLIRFGATALVLGAAAHAFTAAAVRAFTAGSGDPTGAATGQTGLAIALSLLMFAAVATKLVLERSRLVHGDPGHDEVALERTRRLHARALAPRLQLRWMIGLGFGLGAPGAALSLAVTGDAGLAAAAVLLCGLVGCVAGEVMERDLFFRGEAMRGMPGAL